MAFKFKPVSQNERRELQCAMHTKEITGRKTGAKACHINHGRMLFATFVAMR